MHRSLAVVGTAVLLAAVVADSRSAHGTAYNPLAPGGCPTAAVLPPGTTVYLFTGGSAEARGAIRAGEILGVQRPRQDGRWHAVGTVRIDADAGALCFRSVVVEGELRPHDLAPAGAGAALVLDTDAPCLFEPSR